jgi:hypothetical protein
LTGAEPERELIRRIVPFALPAAVVAFVVGTLADGPGAGWSAVIGIALVVVNFVSGGYSIMWAAAISPVLIYGVALGGFVVRLGLALVLILLLRQLDWFSTVAFVAALVPATLALLAVELKLLAGRMQADLWTWSAQPSGVRR